MDLLSRRVLLIENPASRRAAEQRGVVRAAFRADGIRCDVIATERPGHAAEIAANCPPAYDAVFALGGDGTAIEVIGALAGSGRPVGVLPAGTGNLIARSLGISRHLPTAVRTLLDGAVAEIDLGRLSTGRRFAFAAGIGVDARMIEETPVAMKRRVGVLAYAITAGLAVLRHEPFAARITIDGERLERQAVMVMVTNFGTVLNEMLTLGPGIRHDDGMLDLCVFSPGSRLDAARIFWRMLRAQFDGEPGILCRAGRSFRIETHPPRPAEADGELLPPGPLEIEVESAAGTVLIPRRD